MEIILKQDLKGLGFKNDIVKVKNGYGRNFLIPQGKAKRATEANKAEIAARRVELEKQQAAILAAAQARGEKLAAVIITVAQKAGVDGRLFGSVTNGDIADALVAQGFEVTKALVRMPNGPLKTIGDHAVTVALHHDVVVDITVTVVVEA